MVLSLEGSGVAEESEVKNDRNIFGPNKRLADIIRKKIKAGLFGLEQIERDRRPQGIATKPVIDQAGDKPGPDSKRSSQALGLRGKILLLRRPP